jgi:DNA ligase (NAD+)
VLQAATTRGDGEFGEDVTDNVRGIQCVPSTLQLLAADGFHVRGEVVLPTATHNPSTDFTTHPRNIAAGVLARKTQPKDGVGPADLRFYAYDVVPSGDMNEVQKVKYLQRLGFNVGPVLPVLSLPEVGPDSWFPERDKWDFPADGVVIREVVSTKESTNHHPKHSIAWKFAAQTSRSVLRDVEWATTRMGTVTPVAVFDTVQADGALVSRATLHNLGRLETLGLGYADRIEISRRGGVIPHVERVLQPAGLAPFLPPSACPSCGHTLVREPARNPKGECADTLCCINKGCRAQLVDAIRHWCDCLLMDGFGPAVCEKLAPKVEHPAGLYLLDWRDPWFARNLGPTTAPKLAKELKVKSEKCTAVGLLTAMGIPGLGNTTSKELASRWTVDELFDVTQEELEELPGVGPTIAANIVRGLVEWTPYMAMLAQGGFITLPGKVSAPAPRTGPLQGEVLCFTGTLSQPRKAMQAKALEAGGLVESDVTAAVTALVVGADELADQQSSKFRKAVAKGVKVWDEQTFLARTAR